MQPLFGNQKVRLVGVSDKTVAQLLAEHGAEISSHNGPSVIHVFDKFEGAAYTNLVNKGWPVISTRCIRDSTALSKPLPQKPKPVYCRAFEDVVARLALQGLPTEFSSLSYFSSIVSLMNGRIENTWSREVTHLISTEVGTLEYRAAANAGIPVVQPSWLTNSWKAHTILPIENFLLPPLAGCIIAVTGLSHATRQKLQRLVVRAGGQFCPDLNRRCTHLLARYPTGNKYKTAIQWGIHVVTMDWLLDCHNSSVCLDETDYLIPLPPDSVQSLHALTPKLPSLALLSQNSPPPASLSPEQIRLQTLELMELCDYIINVAKNPNTPLQSPDLQEELSEAHAPPGEGPQELLVLDLQSQNEEEEEISHISHQPSFPTQSPDPNNSN